ncbi:NnrS family protein, partial [Burkholderia pseudomallei]
AAAAQSCRSARARVFSSQASSKQQSDTGNVMPLVRSSNHSPLAPPDGRHAALWSTGFRAFYLGGAGFGAIARLAWLGAL